MERWEPIVGAEGYYISNEGRVGSIMTPNGAIGTELKIKKLQIHKPQNLYYKVLLRKKHYYVHQLVMDHFGPPKPPPVGDDEFEIDHRDHDSFNNNISNLRWLLHRQNNYAQKNQTVEKSSQYRGVSWNKRNNNWRSLIMLDGKSINVGSFEFEEEAAEAYNVKAKELFGEYAYQNVIDQ